MLISVHGLLQEILPSKLQLEVYLKQVLILCKISQLEGYLTGEFPLTSGKLISAVTVGGITSFKEL